MKHKGKGHKLTLLFSLLFQSSFLSSNDRHLEVSLSHNTSTWQNNRSGFYSGVRTRRAPQIIYHRQLDLSTLSATQLKKYCEHNNIVEQDIFADPCCFMSDEFVTYAKTLSGYKKTICSLHKKLHKKNTFKKIIGILSGDYTKGLQKRIDYLHAKVHRKKNKQISKLSFLPSITIENEVVNFAQSYDITKQQLVHKFADQSECNRHKEFVNHLSQASELTELYKQAPNCQFFLDAVGHGAAIGIEANIHHEKEVANKWSTFCHEALEIAKGVGEGIKDGVYNTGFC